MSLSLSLSLSLCLSVCFSSCRCVCFSFSLSDAQHNMWQVWIYLFERSLLDMNIVGGAKVSARSIEVPEDGYGKEKRLQSHEYQIDCSKDKYGKEIRLRLTQSIEK